MNFKALLVSKTFWLMLAGICAAVGAKVAGEIDTHTLVIALFNGLGGIFIRDAIANKG